jgi:hypothetical protein
MLRHSPLFQFKHGDHTCVFYRHEDSLREVLTPYIAEGLRRGERCFCAQKAHIGRRLIFDLRFLGIDTDDAIHSGALEIHTEEETYFNNGKFEPRMVMDMLMRSLNNALNSGFTAFRTAGELSWAVEGHDYCDQLLVYESLVDGYYPDKPVIGLCQYDMNAFTPELLEAVIQTHRMHLSDSPSAVHSGISVRSGNYWSEIVADKLVISPSFYYVVRRRKPAEVLGWGIAPTFDLAHEKAEQIVQTADQ